MRTKTSSILGVLAFLAPSVMGGAASTDVPSGSLIRLSVEGTINPVVKDYIQGGIRHAELTGASGVLIRLDTPGGLLDATRDIVQSILNTPLPVVVFIGPQGARAASAGVFITLASDIAAMAPKTHLGAAHPVQVGGGGVPPGVRDPSGEKGPSTVSEEKAVSDTAAFARSLASSKGRDPDWSEKAVRQSLSLTAEEALGKKVIDLVSVDEPALLKALEGRTVKKGDRTLTLSFQGDPVDWPMSSIQRWLHALAHPNVAYMLLVLGFYALVYEFSSPGIGLGGITGVVCLVTAFYSLQVLPLNFAGLSLLVAGLIMMGLDVVTGAHGLLIFGGLLSFVVGSLFLFDGNQPALRVSLTFVAGAAALSFGFFVFVVRSLWVLRLRGPVTGAEGMVGRRGEVRPEGLVFVDGALWSVESGVEGVPPGVKVIVKEVVGNRLIVQKED